MTTVETPQATAAGGPLRAAAGVARKSPSPQIGSAAVGPGGAVSVPPPAPPGTLPDGLDGIVLHPRHPPMTDDSRPVLYDLYSGEGGAGTGYDRAGFHVIGFDHKPQPRYPFQFVQADALEVLAELADARPWPGLPLPDAVHGSPVCKRYSSATPAWARGSHPNQIPPTRTALQAFHARTGAPWVIENVPGAPLRPDIKICGCVVGLHELERERWFETSGWHALDMRPPCYHTSNVITVAGHGEPSGPRSRRGEQANKADWARVMGIDWMTRDGLAQAIPPAYTERIGLELMAYLLAGAA